MSDFESRREERRRTREEWKAKFRDRHGYMMDGAHMRGYSWTGVLLLLIGIAALLKAALVPLPYWLFTWPVLLIVLGFFCRHPPWVSWHILADHDTYWRCISCRSCLSRF